MTWEERIEKFNYVKILNKSWDFYEFEGVFKIKEVVNSFNGKDINVPDKECDDTHLEEKHFNRKWFIFVSDKYANDRGVF